MALATAKRSWGIKHVGDIESKLNSIVKFAGICFAVISLLLTILVNHMN